MRQKVQYMDQKLLDKDSRINLLEKALAERPTNIVAAVAEGSAESQYKELIRQEENKKFAQAAQKTIQTLQGLIEDKNEQLKRKDDMIKKLKDEFLAHKEEDAREIAGLRDQLVKQSNSTIAMLNVQFFSARRDAPGGYMQDARQSRTSEHFRPGATTADMQEVFAKNERAMDEMRRKIDDHLKRQQELQKRLNESYNKQDELEKQLNDERDKNQKDPLAKRVETLQRQLASKDKQLAALDDAVANIKKEYQRISRGATETEQEMHRKLTESSSNQETQMQMAMKRIRELDDKTRKQTKELDELREKNIELQGDNTVADEKLKRAVAENESQKAMMQDAREEVSKLQKEVNEAKDAKANDKYANFVQEANNEKTKVLEDKIRDLETETALLRSATNKPE